MKQLYFPSYIKKGRLAYSIIEHESGAKILKGFYLDSSIDKESFFLQYFVQALYRPFPHLNFSLGDRLGGHLKSSEIDKINTILSSFRDFDNLNCFSDYIPFLNSNHFYGAEINKFECYAFQYYLLGDYAKAKNYFKKIINFENSKNPEWFEDSVRIAREFVRFIDSCMYENGIKTLLLWQEETIKSLKLDV